MSQSIKSNESSREFFACVCLDNMGSVYMIFLSFTRLLCVTHTKALFPSLYVYRLIFISIFFLVCKKEPCYRVIVPMRFNFCCCIERKMMVVVGSFHSFLCFFALLATQFYLNIYVVLHTSKANSNYASEWFLFYKGRLDCHGRSVSSFKLDCCNSLSICIKSMECKEWGSIQEGARTA